MRRVAKQWRTEVNGAVSTFTYDAKDRLTQDATSAPLAHTYTYTYDSRDNILTNSESGGVVQMNYDGASRLTTSTSGGVTTTYTFDSNGNLTGVNAAGTLTTMVYDKENRLKEHKQGAAANTRTFTYDLNSLKQAETFSNATNQLVWDGADMLGEVPAVKPVGAPLMPTRYNLAQGILFATTRFEPAATRTDTGADFIGSILIDFDENGDYIAERRYKPYGELLAGTATTYGWTGSTGSRATLLQYAEQYNRRRNYSTKLKQWTTRDPLWPDESAYGYVRGGPLTWNDPSGLKLEICEWNEKKFGYVPILHSRINSTECEKMIGAGQISFGQSGIVVYMIGTDPQDKKRLWVCQQIDIDKETERCICGHLKNVIWDNGARSGHSAKHLKIPEPGAGRKAGKSSTAFGTKVYDGKSFGHFVTDCNTFVGDVQKVKDDCEKWLRDLDRKMYRKFGRIWHIGS